MGNSTSTLESSNPPASPIIIVSLAISPSNLNLSPITTSKPQLIISLTNTTSEPITFCWGGTPLDVAECFNNNEVNEPTAFWEIIDLTTSRNIPVIKSGPRYRACRMLTVTEPFPADYDPKGWITLPALNTEGLRRDVKLRFEMDLIYGFEAGHTHGANMVDFEVMRCWWRYGEKAVVMREMNKLGWPIHGKTTYTHDDEGRWTIEGRN